MEVKMKGKTLNQDLQVIKYNIFSLAPIIMSFYKECYTKQDNILLSYIIIPLVFSRKWNDTLLNTQKRSNLIHWIKENKIPIEGLSARIMFLRDYPSSALQYCFDMKWAFIDDNNNIILTENREWDISPNNNMKSATKNNLVFKDMTVTQIYSSLGINKICLH